MRRSRGQSVVRSLGGRWAPRIRSRRALVVAAMAVQLALLLIAWTVAFRHVRERIVEAVGAYIVDQNAALVERLAAELPAPMVEVGEGASGFMTPAFGSAEWERWQRVVESAGASLPAGGFACLLDEDGRVLCHPDIREDASLRRVDLGGKLIEAAMERGMQGARGESVRLERAGEETVSGRVRFVADGTHFVATRKVPGTELRLLVHQPEAELFGAANQLTGVVVTSGAIAAGAVVVLGGLALLGVIRSYDSSFELVNRRLKSNLKIAREIQLATLPGRLPRLDGFDVAAWSASAEETGGDMYDIIGLSRAETPSGFGATDGDGDGEGLLCVLADATGHGIGAALAVSQMRAMVRLGLRTGADLPTLVAQVNAQLAADLPAGRFVTAWFGFVDASAGGVLSFAAGQGPVLVRRADGRVESYDADAVPLGIMEGMDVKEGRWIALAPGDAVVVASDGIHESRAPGGGLFGLERLRRLVSTAGGGSAGALIEAVCAEVEAFTGGAEADDDRTLVVVKRP